MKAFYLLEWQKSRIFTTQNSGEGCEQQEFSFIAGGNDQLWHKNSVCYLKYMSFLAKLSQFKCELN